MKGKLTLDEQKELIELASLELNISQFAIEKDIYVTQALEILSEIEDDNFYLIFQGGTCLAKAHQIINRMSEDCDFKIGLKDSMRSASKSSLRQALKKFRQQIANSLKKNDFKIDDEAIKTRNEGRYISIQMEYPQAYTPASSIKPFIACEFFVGELKMPFENKKITSMIKQKLNLNRNIPHSEYTMSCMSVIETAAEKWVGLTRRIATAQQRNYYYDKNLVRHLYDLYQINKFSIDTRNFSDLVKNIVLSDSIQFKTHNKNFYSDPAEQIKLSITELRNNSLWEKNWNEFLEAMVFDQQYPNYDEALKNLELLTGEVIPIFDK